MGVEGKFLQAGIVALETESRADDGVASAAIEEIFGFDVCGDASGRPTAYDCDVIECACHLIRVCGY